MYIIKMSTFIRPRHRFNRQICQNLTCNVGRNQYGLANQKPNNPLYFTLASMKKAIADGKFMKKTVTGTALPNPVKQLKEFVNGGSSGNKPGPKMPKSLNTYVSREPENQANNNQVRRQAMRELRLEVRGRAAVAQPPPGPPPRSVVDAQTRRNLFNTVEIPSNLTSEERKSFFSPMPKVQRGLGTPATPVQEITNKANQEALSEMDSFYNSIIKNPNTPATSAQPPVSRKERAGRRRRLVLEDDKKASRMEEGRGRQQAIINSYNDEKKEKKED
jgi:hypothetical protein